MRRCNRRVNERVLETALLGIGPVVKQEGMYTGDREAKNYRERESRSFQRGRKWKKINPVGDKKFTGNISFFTLN